MKILMVSTEYPPMPGGVGRYTYNLTCALRALGSGVEEVTIACDSKGDGDYAGVISPSNMENSANLLNLVKKIKPDIVHVQFEPGLYGLSLDPVNPKKTMTHIDRFYEDCRVPIVTTFHSAYTFSEWMMQSALVKKNGRTGQFGIPARMTVRAWKDMLNYHSFHDLNREKLKQSQAGIGFSRYIVNILKGGHVIYHGAEPAASLNPLPSKEEARAILALPHEKKLAVAVGFGTVNKGWDILEKMHMPEGWSLVINSSKSHYSTENFSLRRFGAGEGDIIDLQRGFLSDNELSTLLLGCDIVLLPYRVASGSGVMFDALAHGLPFVASNLEFFREFADMGLGIAAHRDTKSFVKAITKVGDNYDVYSNAVDKFRKKLRWDYVAQEHVQIYKDVIQKKNTRKLQS